MRTKEFILGVVVGAMATFAVFSAFPAKAQMNMTGEAMLRAWQTMAASSTAQAQMMQLQIQATQANTVATHAQACLMASEQMRGSVEQAVRSSSSQRRGAHAWVSLNCEEFFNAASQQNEGAN